MILDLLQIATYAYANGFRGESVAYTTACAMAESSGDTDIISGMVSDGTRGYGLMQIETENLDGGDWQDPNWQMQKAFAMSSGGLNYNPWCTACAPMPNLVGGKGCGGYGTGNAAKYLVAAYAAAAEVHVVVPPAVEPTWPGVDLRLLTPNIIGHGTGLWQSRMNVLRMAVLVVDGDYGPDTAGATVHFQHMHDLVPDGVVGVKSWGAAFV